MSAGAQGPHSGDVHVATHISDIAREAGALLLAMQGMPRTVDEKAQADLVTDADRAAEALVRERVSARFPGARMILEEGGAQQVDGTGHEDLTFIVDPLDGTTNYASGIPHFAVSIGVKRAHDIVAGAIYHPHLDELFVAVRGGGARLFDPRRPLGVELKVSAASRLIDSVVATGFAYGRYTNPDDNGVEFCALNLLTRGCRRNGAAALDLAWVAAGRFDAYWERGLKAWDLAAGALLVEEAGGMITDYEGGPLNLDVGEVVVSNGRVHAGVLKSITHARDAAAIARKIGCVT